MTPKRTYAALVEAWRTVRPLGPIVREIACSGPPRTLLCVDAGRPDRPAVHLIAGVHGDEPAAPWALLSAVRDGLLDPRFAYRIWPCLNPSGYERGTRENAEGADINRSFSRGGTTHEARALFTANRDRRFVLALDLHEDFEAAGGYLYEPLRPGASPRYGAGVIAALDEAGLPVQDLADGYDLGAPPGTPLDGLYVLGRGTCRVDYEAELRMFPGLPSSIALMYRGAAAALTFESPRPRPWDERIAAHRTFLTTVLARTADG